MNRQEEALRLAEELLTDVELSRVEPDAALLKGMRLARLTDNFEAQDWLRLELGGYTSADAAAARLCGRSAGDDKFYSQPLGALLTEKRAREAQLESLRIESIGGDGAI